jgi:hypothetical protein
VSVDYWYEPIINFDAPNKQTLHQASHCGAEVGLHDVQQDKDNL